MIAAFGLDNPSLPILVGLLAVALVLWFAARPSPALESGVEITVGRANLLRHPAAFAALICGALFLLYASHTPLAEALVLMVAGIAAYRLSLDTYVGRAGALSPKDARRCALARTVAWIALILIVAGPGWNWFDVEWEKPVAVIISDQSQSMSIVDPGAGETRAARANRALSASGAALRQLAERYDLRFLALSDVPHDASDAQVNPGAPITPLAITLRQAAQMRGSDSAAPAAVVLISDGAENAGEPQVVRDAATELAAQRTALLAAGAGLPPGKAPSLFLDPLLLPARISPREQLSVPVTLRAAGCDGRKIHVEARWSDAAVAAQVEVPIEHGPAPVRHDFSLKPPEAGVQTITVRAVLPAELGGGVAERSAVVDVRDDRIHVLWLGSGPRQEAAFALRALRGDPQFEIDPRFAGAGAGRADAADLPAWKLYDVVILDDVPAARLDRNALDALVTAVTEDGVGLLLSGGAALFHNGFFSESDLRDVSPTAFVRNAPRELTTPFVPTEAGLRHPVLISSHDGEADLALAAGRWKNLPALVGGVRLGAPKPLAVVLAEDGQNHALLAVHDAGRGRCAAAGWAGTWPIALASDDGLAAHRLLWRQLVSWLANRKPAAWVSVDQPRYSAAALQRGRLQVAIRAGVAGIPDEAWRRRVAAARFTLEMRRKLPASQSAPSTAASGGATWTIPMQRRGDEAFAELPRDLRLTDWIAAAEFELNLTISPPDVPTSAGSTADRTALAGLTARTSFRVESVELEFREPTANLALLREAAELTAEHGGRFVEIDALPELLRDLAANDRRQRIERPQRYAAVDHLSGWLWGIAVGALAYEWSLRRRAGQA